MSEETLTRETHFRGSLLQLDVLKVRLQDGKIASREIVLHANAVCAAVFTKDGQGVLVKQFRKPTESLEIEVPAGKIDGGEDPDKAVVRELQEEIGYVEGKVEKLMDFWSSPGFCTERMTVYLVTEAVLGPHAPEEGEFLEIVTVPQEEMIAMAMDGRVSDAKSVAAILAAARKLGL